MTARCYAGEGRLAYAPIAAWLKSDAMQSTLMRLDASRLTDVARLRPELVAARPEIPAPDRELESWQRLRFFEALAQAFQSAAPLVLVLDDLQWADADTIEWLQYFLRSASDTRCLVVGTVRAEEEQDNPPLGRLLGRLERDDLLTAITLGPLDQAATAQLAGEVAEQPLDDAALARTFRETEGHPLFIVERGRMELTRQPGAPLRPTTGCRECSLLSRRGWRCSRRRRAPPPRSRQRWDAISGSTSWRKPAISRRTRSSARSTSSGGATSSAFRRTSGGISATTASARSHTAQIGPARRRLIHRRIAQGMELLFANRLDEVSASIAVHLDRGGHPARAVPFLERAAAVATRVSANEEAIRCLTHALSLLERLPAGRDRDEQELALRSSLSVALNSARGYAAPEVEQNLNRVFMLLRSAGRGEVPVRWMWVAFTLRFVLGDLKGTREVSEQALARSVSDPSCRCEAHHAMGGTLSSMGELDASRHHFEAALAAYDERHPQRSALGSDLGVFAHAWYAHTLWLLGDERAAVSHVEQAVALARRLDHVYSQTLALAYAGMLHQMRRDADHGARVRERRCCAVRAVWIRLLRRLGPGPDWMGARTGAARRRSRDDRVGSRSPRRKPRAGAPAVLSVVARRDV